MKSYLEIKVPISFDDYWFRELRGLLDDVNIRWQQGYYHITMAFLDYAPDNANMIPGLNAILDDAAAPVITFDKLDAFSSGYHRQVIHLTTTDAPADFLETVKDIRSGAGFWIERAHATGHHQRSGPSHVYFGTQGNRVPCLPRQNARPVETYLLNIATFSLLFDTRFRIDIVYVVEALIKSTDRQDDDKTLEFLDYSSCADSCIIRLVQQ